MALDQRYCLNCGKRRGSPRVDYDEYLKTDTPGPPEPPQIAAPPAPPDNRPEREVTPLMAACGLAGLAAILILGVLIGRTGDGGSQAAAPVIAATGVPTTTAGSTTDTTTTTTTVEFTADWPEGKEGFTIELATLPKEGSDGTAVEAAKAELLGQGATEVGALDSDEYASLPAGNYVLYSGVYDTKADAESALAPLAATFPDAEVVEVSASAGAASGGGTETAEKTTSSGDSLTDGGVQDPDEVVEATDEALQALDEATGDEYQEQQKKLPPTIKTPGEAPPKDNKAPGGGSGNGVTIG
ncbi:MAG: hypothetical protein ACSLFD_11415 [Solirubrobacterales bacterium]